MTRISISKKTLDKVSEKIHNMDIGTVSEYVEETQNVKDFFDESWNEESQLDAVAHMVAAGLILLEKKF